MRFVSKPSREKHPERIGLIASLCGVDTADVTNSRILELGCGSGENLLALACGLPKSTFIGIDYSKESIDIARNAGKALFLQNVAFIHADLRDELTEIGQVDYLLCQGVLSWVDDATRRSILCLAGKLLAPNGIACISYNAWPGWSTRKIIRDTLLEKVDTTLPIDEQVALARGELSKLEQQCLNDSSASSQGLLQELVNIRSLSDAFILHELLSQYCKAFSFEEFEQMASSEGLKYLGDANPGRAFGQVQHVDKISFRQSIICRKDVALARDISLAKLESAFFSSPLMPASEITHEGTNQFFRPNGEVVLIDEQPFARALQAMSRAWPKALSYADLKRQAEFDGAIDDLEILQCLWDFFSAALVDIYFVPPKLCTTVSQFPRAFAFSRLQALTTSWVTTLRHEYVILDQLERYLLTKLDGTFDFASLLNFSKQLITSGTIQMALDGDRIIDPLTQNELLEEKVHDTLARFAELALLEA